MTFFDRATSWIDNPDIRQQAVSAELMITKYADRDGTHPSVMTCRINLADSSYIQFAFPDSQLHIQYVDLPEPEQIRVERQAGP